jgi:hypothetical protein
MHKLGASCIIIQALYYLIAFYLMIKPISWVAVATPRLLLCCLSLTAYPLLSLLRCIATQSCLMDTISGKQCLLCYFFLYYSHLPFIYLWYRYWTRARQENTVGRCRSAQENRGCSNPKCSHGWQRSSYKFLFFPVLHLSSGAPQHKL